MTTPNQLREYTAKEFIRLYMNDHNRGTPRWLRGAFLDEKEKIEIILEYMYKMEAKLEEAKKEAVEGACKRAEEIVATEMDNLSVKTTNAEFIACDDLAINIINKLRQKYEIHKS